MISKSLVSVRGCCLEAMLLNAVLPAKVGTLPVFLTELLGEKGSLFLLVGSGRLTLAPSGPGQGLHPNWLSLQGRKKVVRRMDYRDKLGRSFIIVI